MIYYPAKQVNPRSAKLISLVLCGISTLYALYPVAENWGFESTACGDRKTFLINELCPNELGDGENVKFAEMTTFQMVYL